METETLLHLQLARSDNRNNPMSWINILKMLSYYALGSY